MTVPSFIVAGEAAHSLPVLVFLPEAEERGCVSFSLSVCFSMIQY